MHVVRARTVETVPRKHPDNTARRNVGQVEDKSCRAASADPRYRNQ